MRVVSHFAPLCIFLLLSGCQRLNYETTLSLPPVVPQLVSFTAPAYQQKLTISVSGAKEPVSAYLVKTGEEDNVGQVLDTDKPLPPGAVLGSKVSKTAEDYSFEATVPAHLAYTILLRAEKKSTDVKLKVVGR